MLAIAIPFYVVFFNNTQNWWALIPAGVMTLIALGLLFTTDLFVYIAPFFLVLAGIWILVRQFRGSAQADLPQEVSEAGDTMEDVHGE
jgi:H+/Cl- antiporter ClcA